MHIAVVGPINIASLAPLLQGDDRLIALDQPGGNGTAPGRIVTALHERGHEVSVVTHRRGRGQLSLEGKRLVIRQVASRSNRAAQIASRWADERTAMAEQLEQLHPDVAHSQWAYEASLACLDSGFPHVATIRDAPLTVLRFDPRPTRFIRASMAYEFRLRSGMSVLTAPSPYMAQAWNTQTLDRRSLHVVPNPVPLTGGSVLPVKADTPLLVEIADGGRRKNVRGLLLAFALVRAEVPDAALVLIGDGLTVDGSIYRWAAGRDLVAGVNFLGKLPADEVQGWLSRAWLHVHAAFEESFGNTLVEALAFGTAVVGGANSAAVPWVLANGDAGILTNVTRPQEFAAAMILGIRDSQLRNRLAAIGMRRAIEKFSPDSIARQYEAVYDIALGR